MHNQLTRGRWKTQMISSFLAGLYFAALLAGGNDGLVWVINCIQLGLLFNLGEAAVTLHVIWICSSCVLNACNERSLNSGEGHPPATETKPERLILRAVTLKRFWKRISVCGWAPMVRCCSGSWCPPMEKRPSGSQDTMYRWPNPRTNAAYSDWFPKRRICFILFPSTTTTTPHTPTHPPLLWGDV